jgi:Flp pilus assembly protein TadG
MMLRRQPKRDGHAIVESALVYPILFLVMMAIVLLGLAVFRYQQVSHMAQEGARYASVHGARYSMENATPAATPVDVYNNAILPHAAGMQASAITYSVTWDVDNTQTSTVVVGDSMVTRENAVSVTVTYTWNTGLFGTIPVSRTATSKMHY